MSLVVGFCVILAATTKDLQHCLRQFNEMLAKIENTAEKETELKQDLLEIFGICFKMKK